jgi:acetate kinase
MSSCHTQEYMLLYKTLHQMQLEQKAAASLNSKPSLPIHKPLNFNHELIEKIIKAYKSHCNTQDFDSAFIKNLRNTDEKLAYIQEVVSKMKVSL